jgi:DNA mismatch repair protein MSH5
MGSLLNQVAMNIATTIPEEFRKDLNIIYFPQLGFNIAIPLDETGRAAFDGGGEGWEQVFTTENRAYFKDFRMREMDQKLGDMYGLICGRHSLD